MEEIAYGQMRIIAYDENGKECAEAFPSSPEEKASMIHNFSEHYSRVETMHLEDSLFLEEDIIQDMVDAVRRPPIIDQIKLVDLQVEMMECILSKAKLKDESLRPGYQEELAVWRAIKENLIACRLFEAALSEEK